MKALLALLLLLALLGGGAWGVGYFFDPTVADLRDVVIIVYGLMGIVLFTVLVAVVVGLFFAVRSLARKFEQLLDEPIRPTLDEIRETARNARGASEFYADHAVNPLFKTVAAARGIRRGLSSLGRLAGRGRKKR
jgi:hypothetical protein